MITLCERELVSKKTNREYMGASEYVGFPVGILVLGHLAVSYCVLVTTLVVMLLFLVLVFCFHICGYGVGNLWVSCG